MGLRRTGPLDGESTSDRTPLRSIRGGRSGGGARLRRAARDRRGQGDPARCASDRRRTVDGLEPRSDRRTMDGDVHVASRRAPRSISRGRVVDRSLPHTCGCRGPASSLGGIDQGPRHRAGTRARLPVPPRRSGRHRHAGTHRSRLPRVRDRPARLGERPIAPSGLDPPTSGSSASQTCGLERGHVPGRRWARLKSDQNGPTPVSRPSETSASTTIHGPRYAPDSSSFGVHRWSFSGRKRSSSIRDSARLLSRPSILRRRATARRSCSSSASVRFLPPVPEHSNRSRHR